MARPKPHPLALFSIVPKNDGAWAILHHPHNRHLVSVVPDPEVKGQSTYGLNIGFHIGSKSRSTLATLGRGADVTVEGANISRIQCSFEIHETTREIMLYDRSTSHSTQVCGTGSTPFKLGHPRRVVVDNRTNLEFGFGGVACNLAHFHLIWHARNFSIEEQINCREDKPCLARTVDETPTVVPSQRVTRIHTPGNQHPEIRYTLRVQLGKGSFGEVWRVANIDSGEHLAVKMVEWPALQSHNYILLKREVETLARISHPNIIEYISAQGPKDNYLEIFMGVRDGTVQDLIRVDDLFVRDPLSADLLLHQMLQALDYLTFKGLIHRDVKPENVLYTALPDGSYHYQLTDFGLCNVIGNARTFAGSGFYIAPELENNRGAQQTSKMDVWSLLVTLTYAMNMGRFREKPLHTIQLRIKAVHEAVSEEIFRPLRDMAHIDPNQRASAADMLDELFNGVGRTTPRNQIRNDITQNALLRPQVQQFRPSDEGGKRPEQLHGAMVTKRPEQGTNDQPGSREASQTSIFPDRRFEN
ncbi:predicted protein [Uncinocarpus reesii 1704]|uniref:Serine/threonine-protein kinase ATG1 n=1 Tax=Uncinocarpus reesii (strain UAMH 1704) TaxID=336963 RepID=C4JQQ8_UNCRE|nr:uncharacterized protein UREG_04725 [Uncinocarpus reesii 1704]EEP79879.1 predicted protein [Uncinocarpus reesii 1704]